jgi:hydrogenase nickel incorporation protein HypA/HybF
VHELSLMQDLAAAVDARVREAGRRRATRVVLEVGRVSGVLPDALRFCFDACTRGSAAEGAELEILEITARAVCRTCGAELTPSEAYAVCRCGSARLDWLAGRELRLKALEVS